MRQEKWTPVHHCQALPVAAQRPAMIIRVYRCTVVADKDAEFREFAFSKSHPWLRERPACFAMPAVSDARGGR